MFKKSLLTVLALLSLAAALLAGCASGEPTTSTAATNTTATTTPATSTAPASTSAAPATTAPTTSPTSTKTGSGAGTGTATAAPTTTATPTSSALLKVTKAGATLKSFSLSDIGALPTVNIVADGKNYTGPTLATLLTQAGVTSYSKITIKGYVKGRVATGELVVTKEEVNDKLILRSTNSNTYSLASPDIDADSWIIDVNELVVE